MDFNSPNGDYLMGPDREQAIYRTMMDLSSDVTFEWDMQADRFICSPKWNTRFGYTPLSTNFIRDLPQVPHVHPDDLILLTEQIGQFRKGKHYGETIVRILGQNGRYTWNRIRASAQCTEDGTPIKLIGVITDIDSEQRNSQALLAKTEQDSLTGLLNKDAARRRIDNYLSHAESNQRAALLIIDLDNFKAVNDKYGHLFGDTVLSRVAATIRGLFREKDILARIGGDEFLVFMMDIPDPELAERRCEKLTDALQHLYDCQLKSCKFSCSIGIAVMPDHGMDYQELFQRADRALYQAKNLGKNTYACYTSDNTPTRYETKIDSRIESEESHSDSFSALAAHMLERLYETRNLTNSLQTTMEVLGTQLQVDRVFILDASGAEKNYEWKKDNVPSTAGTDQMFVNVLRSHIMEALFRYEDIYYCHDSSILPEELQPMAHARQTKALLLCAVRTNGAFDGFVGMETCVRNRLWTQNEIDMLTSLSHLAALFLWRHH